MLISNLLLYIFILNYIIIYIILLNLWINKNFKLFIYLRIIYMYHKMEIYLSIWKKNEFEFK